jgi:membrane protein YqaA with SNARE-associated domain
MVMQPDDIQYKGSKETGHSPAYMNTYICFTLQSFLYFIKSLMYWQYLLLFVSAFAVDVVPLPLPPAFTIMVLLQLVFGLNIWVVIVIGVAGSIAGRYVLTLYIPIVSGRIFNPSKNADVQYLGHKLKQKGWESQVAILVYSLLPLPTTPLFIAGGMAKMKPYYIIPAFCIGKFASDSVAVLMGSYAAENTAALMHGMVNWKTMVGLGVGLTLIFGLLFIDWRTLLQQGRLRLLFNIWK